MNKLFSNYQFSHGFTLIELLVSISIISILLGISFAGYATLNQRQTLTSAGQNLKNIIRDAQSRTMNKEIDCGICDCSSGGDTKFSGWYVDFTSQKIYGKCDVSTFGDKGFNLSSDIAITPFVTPANQIIFNANPLSVSGKSTVCVLHNNLPGNYYVIHLNESGAMSDEGGLVPSCTP